MMSRVENEQVLTIDKLLGLRQIESKNYSFRKVNSHLTKRSVNKDPKRSSS